MTRLQSEFQRLYRPLAAADTDTDGLIGTDGTVRAMVLELARPADWDLLSTVWRGVQADLELPAPAIAVSGTEGFQLWFSLAEPVALSRAHAFLAALQQHYLPDVAARRVTPMPARDVPAPRVPAPMDNGNWSAFVAPDLAPVFADTPWLDIPPGDEGQAELLRRLHSIQPAELEAALKHLRSAMAPPPGPAEPSQAPHAADGATLKHSGPPAATFGRDPKRFLEEVMNDETVALSLRIEAAKALLPHTGNPGDG